jgi:hypothetical protein
MAGLAGDCKAQLERNVPNAGLSHGQIWASTTFDLAQSLGDLARLGIAKAAAAMARGGLLLCLGGLDRTGNTAAIGAALALIPAFSALAKGHSIAKSRPSFGRLVGGTVKLNADLK